MCLAVVLACHLLLVGWIVFAGFEAQPDITPPMTGMLLAGGSGSGSGTTGKQGGASPTVAGTSKSDEKKTAARTAKKDESAQTSKPEPVLRQKAAKELPADAKKGVASSALSGKMRGSPKTGINPVQGPGNGNGSDKGTGKEATGTGSAGNGGSGNSGPYTDAGFFSNPKPPYPPVSRRMAEEGTVLLSVHIRTDGQVDEVKLKRSSGFSRLDDSAIRTVRKWRYVPAKRNGQPIPYWYTQPIRFSLDD